MTFKASWAVAGLALAVAGTATADDLRIGHPYVGANFIYEVGDSDRNSDDGYGFQLTFGLPVFSYENLDVEFGYSALQRDRDIDGRTDYTRTIHADFLYRFAHQHFFGEGDAGFGNPVLHPFALAGLGLVEEDAAGDSGYHLGASLGGGTLIDFGLPYDTLVRTELRALYQRNDDTIPGDSSILDFRVMVGLQLPIPGFGGAPAAVPPPSAPPACDVAVVDPVTGRTDCDTDSDGDGVFDSVDQCPGTLPGTVVDATGCPVELTPQVIRGVHFEFDSAVLTAESKGILDGTATALMEMNDPSLLIEIGGHTDDRGGDAYNNQLSQARAESVRQYLMVRDIPADQLTAKGYGASQPLTGNDTEEGRAENRRVEFRIVLR
jgi:OmpA-OmpF porin, OOP family